MPSTAKVIQKKEPSEGLLNMINQAAHNFVGFATVWSRVLEKGKQEGFTEKELQDLIRPLLKKSLNRRQIYYAFNKESELENLRKKKAFKIEPNDGKIVPYDSSEHDPDWNGEAAEEEEESELEAQIEQADEGGTTIVDLAKIKSVGAFPDGELEETEVWQWLLERTKDPSRFYFEDYVFQHPVLGYPKGTKFKRVYIEK